MGCFKTTGSGAERGHGPITILATAYVVRNLTPSPIYFLIFEIVSVNIGFGQGGACIRINSSIARDRVWPFSQDIQNQNAVLFYRYAFTGPSLAQQWKGFSLRL